MKKLEEKLQEYKINHKVEEEAKEDEITTLEDKLTDVKASLERRKRELELEVEADAAAAADMSTSLPANSGAFPTAPTIDRDSFESIGSSCVYPTLPVASARSTTALNRNLFEQSSNRSPPRRGQAPMLPHVSSSSAGGGGGGGGTTSSGACYNSEGSSPHMSQASGSSRSVTPKTDSDFDCSV
jgi:hypothetical protein